ncbi:hypothetical protein P171DRAFT_491456 [Karstenula rhodostoma CBS 690.94]|uniref:Mid2 domain-containing protein n=1 Tax=Karstenula rhodostoma CBS 690.94 TaxID=1392251 RepID=A0A9P4P7K8_9PLEO|nr:hypothetical protein P171DRAFT_491456 [Karstenula rhodostoma CBS 690.94]
MALSNLALDPTMDTAPNGTCYSITGLASPFNDYTYIPCNLTAIENGQHSACCASGDTCLTNGLCKYNPPTPVRNFNTYWRIGCTDPTYQDPSCPKQCKNKENVERHVHIVFECPGDGQWCCGTGATGEYENTLTVNTTCCNIPDLAFSDEAREAYATAKSDWRSGIEMQTFAALAENSTAMDATSAATMSPTSQSVRHISHMTPTSIPLATAYTPPVPAPPSASSNTVALGIGLGLGIPLIIALLALLTFLLHRHRRRRNRNTQHSRIAELAETQDNVRHVFPHAVAMEKSGREVPAELSAERGVHELGRPDSWRTGDDGKAGWGKGGAVSSVRGGMDGGGQMETRR